MRRRKKKKASEIPVASFSDIAFLLIIFFMITTAFVNHRGFDSEIPSGEQGEQQEEKMNTVKLHDSNIRLNEKPMQSIAQLRTALLKLELYAKTGDQEKVVILEPTGSISYQRYYEVMYTISDVGGVVAILRENE